MTRIQAQKRRILTEDDRLQLATLLVKAGYVVRIGSENTASGKVEHYVEYGEAGRGAGDG